MAAAAATAAPAALPTFPPPLAISTVTSDTTALSSSSFASSSREDSEEKNESVLLSSHIPYSPVLAAAAALHSPEPDGIMRVVAIAATSTTTTTTTAMENDDGIDNDSSLPSLPYYTIPYKWIQFYNNHCIYFPAMIGWFFFSACLSAFNKFVFGKGHLAFPCPLLLTSMHFGYQWAFAAACCTCFPVTLGHDRIARMTWREYVRIAVPCGCVTSADVGLSNLSMVTISITFYTMVKASTPIFVLAWAYLFGIERITWTLLSVVAIIAVGEMLTVLGEVEFEWTGFLLCLSASWISGARWTLVQLKVQSMDPPLKTTIATMKLLAPSMFVTMLIASCLIERPWTRFGQFHSAREYGYVLGLGSVGAAFAISMILCEFYLIMYSSAVILMIGGVLKEMLTIVVGVTVFEDKLNRINIVGCLIVFSGIVLYKVAHYRDTTTTTTTTTAMTKHHHRHHTQEEEEPQHPLRRSLSDPELTLNRPLQKHYRRNGNISGSTVVNGNIQPQDLRYHPVEMSDNDDDDDDNNNSDGGIDVNQVNGFSYRFRNGGAMEELLKADQQGLSAIERLGQSGSRNRNRGNRFLESPSSFTSTSSGSTTGSS